jgi:ribosome-associated protein
VEDSDLPKSKSQRKREATALQSLGERLLDLRPDQLAGLPLDEALREAVLLAQRIRARGGRRRQLQLIGKLMRSADGPAIERALAGFGAVRRAERDRLHALEGWRARLVEDGAGAVPDLLRECPGIDAGTLTGLIQAARRDAAGGRALFRYLREHLARAEEPAAAEVAETGRPTDAP